MEYVMLRHWYEKHRSARRVADYRARRKGLENYTTAGDRLHAREDTSARD
jgi:hypothetical protein